MIADMGGRCSSEEVAIFAASEGFVEFYRMNFLDVGNHIILLNMIILNIKALSLVPAILSALNIDEPLKYYHE